jgi:type IV secretory pathway VirB3-like protein
MFGAGAIPVFRGCENAVVAAGRGLWMIVSVLLNLVVIILVIIPMNVCLHDLMIIWLAIVRAILRADQRWAQCGHRESR